MFVRLTRAKWARGEVELEKRWASKTWKTSDETKELLDRTYNILGFLPWAGAIQGFSVDVEMHYLASFLTRDWLTTEHEDQLISLLRHDLMQSELESQVELELTYFIPKIEAAFAHRDMYATNPEYQWLRAHGQALCLGTCSRIGAIVNIEGYHWTAVAFDGVQNVIWYGDSLAEDIGEKLRAALQWWVLFHTGIEFKVTHASNHEADQWLLMWFTRLECARCIPPSKEAWVNGCEGHC